MLIKVNDGTAEVDTLKQKEEFWRDWIRSEFPDADRESVEDTLEFYREEILQDWALQFEHFQTRIPSGEWRKLSHIQKLRVRQLLEPERLPSMKLF